MCFGSLYEVNNHKAPITQISEDTHSFFLNVSLCNLVSKYYLTQFTVYLKLSKNQLKRCLFVCFQTKHAVQ